MKKIVLNPAFYFFICFIGMAGCKKSSSDGAGSAGSFTVNGTTYNGVCSTSPDSGVGYAGNIDVLIGLTSQYPQFTIYDMPQQSSGTFNFVNGSNSIGSTLGLSGAYVSSYSSSGSGFFVAQNGSVTKTGANSFTFSCNMINILNQTVSATGKGSY
jgi:hypothetical protein